MTLKELLWTVAIIGVGILVLWLTGIWTPGS